MELRLRRMQKNGTGFFLVMPVKGESMHCVEELSKCVLPGMRYGLTYQKSITINTRNVYKRELCIYCCIYQKKC